MSKQTWTPGEDGDNGEVIKAVIDDNFTELYTNLDIANVKNYGAVGDGVTDDYAAIQAALNSSANNVQIGDATTEVYLLSQVLLIPSNKNVIIHGTLKIQDSVLTTVTADIIVGANTFSVTSADAYTVGQYVMVTDDDQHQGYETYRAWAGYITDITGLTITLDTVTGLTITAASNARVAHGQSCILIYNKENISIRGYGILDGNRYGQEQFHPSHTVTTVEEQRGASALNIIDSENIELYNLRLNDGLMHTLTLSGETGGSGNDRLILNKVACYGGHDKNILARFVANSFFTDIYCEGATWEDNLIFYASCENINVNGFTGKNAARYSFCWNSNSNFGLNANNIICQGIGEFQVSARDANISNVYITDEVRFIINAGYTVENINITNVVIQGVTASPIIYFTGEVDRVTINNLWMDGCTGTAIQSWSGGAEPQNIKIIGGGIHNHTGTIENLQVGTDIEYYAFDK